MRWMSVLKQNPDADSIAELWATNDAQFYKGLLDDINFLIGRGHDHEEIMSVLPQILSEKMSIVSGFTQELDEKDVGLSEIDWEKVAEQFNELIRDMIDDAKV